MLSAQAAVGALKATLDGLASKVAALQAKVDAGSGGPGGGGASVYTSAGVRPGTLIDYGLVAQRGNDPQIGMVVATSSGTILRLRKDGRATNTMIRFEGANCTGQAWADLVDHSLLGQEAVQSWADGGRWFVPSELSGYLAYTAFTGSSSSPKPKSMYIPSGGCGANSGGPKYSYYIKVKYVAPGDIGVPASWPAGVTIRP